MSKVAPTGAIVSHQDVLGLQISVNDARTECVRVSQGAQDVNHDRERRFQIQWALSQPLP
jgi:hypothetical protein